MLNVRGLLIGAEPVVESATSSAQITSSVHITGIIHNNRLRTTSLYVTSTNHTPSTFFMTM